jgi:hypothetical protein
MLTRTGADPIDGADPDRASGSMPRPALGSGGAERGIPTAGIRVGIPAGAQIRSATTATGTDADAAWRRPSLSLKEPLRQLGKHHPAAFINRHDGSCILGQS